MTRTRGWRYVFWSIGPSYSRWEGVTPQPNYLIGPLSWSSCDVEQVPRFRNPLELMRATILELEPRASHEITRRRRHEHLARTGATSYARADVHSYSARLFAVQTLDFARCARLRACRARARAASCEPRARSGSRAQARRK